MARTDPATPSLRARLTALLLLAVLATALVQVAITWRSALAETEAVFDAQMERIALSLTGGLAASVLGDDALAATRGAEELIIQIWRADGSMLYRSPSARLLPPQAVIGFSSVHAGGEDWRVYALQTPSQVIQIAQAERARRRMAGQLALRAVLPVALLAPVLMLIVWWVVGHALAPVQRLRRQLAARGAADLAPLPTEDLPAEVQPLVAEMNALLARLSAAWQQLADFTADAAHELRTPIAAIRMQAQVAQGATQDEERRAALDATIAGCDRATRLVDQLLQLARLEADAVDTQPAAGRDIPTDLTAVAARLVRELSDAARARGQQIRLECPPRPVDVPMSAALTAVLLRNLLDNALRYGPDGGTVAVQLLPAQATHGVRLCVEDAGPGLSDADLARLGERFFRVLGSGQSGSGLGWSIVRRLARLHALQLHIDRSPALGGLRVTVDWPRA